MEKISIKYSGPVSLNSRTLQDVSQTILGKKNSGESLRDVPMYSGELFSLLNFLEVSTMSNKIYYDGTLPKHELENLSGHVSHLEQFSQSKVRPIHANSEAELLQFCKSAAEQSSELFNQIDVNSLQGNGIDRPVKKNQEFKSILLKKYNRWTEREEEAHKIVHDIVAGKETFNGSKCLAGILSANLEEFDLLQIIAEKFLACKDESQEEYLVGSLINRFRINYINKISSQDKYEAAYLIDPSMESIQSQQVMLLWKYMLRRIQRKYEDNQYKKVQNLFSGKYSTFPLGVAALLNLETTNVKSLFNHTSRLKDDMFLKILAKHTPQERFVHQFDTEEFLAFQDEVLASTFHKLNTKKFKICEFVNNRIPEVIGTTTSIALAAFMKDIDPYLEMATGVASALVLPQMLSKGLEFILPSTKYNVFVNNMTKLEDFFRNSIESNEVVERRLFQQIETVFGRKLILSSK